MTLDYGRYGIFLILLWVMQDLYHQAYFARTLRIASMNAGAKFSQPAIEEDVVQAEDGSTSAKAISRNPCVLQGLGFGV